MLYPLKFYPLYKDYIWGGRNLESIGKTITGERVAESWEAACHSDGTSIISNGIFEGMSLTAILEEHGSELAGRSFSGKFPLLIKLIDANDRLSVQVHPDDCYAAVNENGEYGKNEAWYIIAAKPGAKIIYGMKPGVTKEEFTRAVWGKRVEECLNTLEVTAGDVINIPAGTVHALGAGILLAEVQQNSNTTYRVYDYERVDKHGNTRPLHVEKALEVINFNASCRGKVEGLAVNFERGCAITYKIANKYFGLETCEVKEKLSDTADGSKFFIYTLLEGACELSYDGGSLKLDCGETVLIPACLGDYEMKGCFSAMRSYVPDIARDVLTPLKRAGYTEEEIYKRVDISFK